MLLVNLILFDRERERELEIAKLHIIANIVILLIIL